ncbi:MAG: SMC-Scp complex subunit ScpB [Oligoflexales bacterium]
MTLEATLPFAELECTELEKQIEALIFASPTPIKPSQIESILGEDSVTTKSIQEVIDRLHAFYQNRNGGFRLEDLDQDGYQFQTHPETAELMEQMFSKRPRPLSRAAQETLAIIAYRQPVTRADIEFIRGVDAGSILKNLLERDLVECVGRKEDTGRPMLFGTTREFLKVYGLGHIDELPPLSAFQPEAKAMMQASEALDNKDQKTDAEDFVQDRGSNEQRPEI